MLVLTLVSVDSFMCARDLLNWLANFHHTCRDMSLRGSIILKNRHFISQERFNKLIYGINTIIKCGT